MTRVIVTAKLVNNAQSVPPLHLNLVQQSPVKHLTALILSPPISQLALVAKGGAAPYTYSASGLPSGLTLNTATGEISGTPTALGHTVITASAIDSSTNTVGPLQFSIDVVSRLTFVQSAPPDGYSTELYSYTFQVSGATGAVTWAVTSGSLTGTGLSLSSSGVLSGIVPTQSANPNNYTFVATATDAGSGDTLDIPCSVNMYIGLHGFIVAAANGVVGTSFLYDFSNVLTNQGKLPFVYYFDNWTSSVSGDPPTSKPAWINSSAATLSGNAPAAGNVTTIMHITDSLGSTLGIGITLRYRVPNQILVMKDAAGDVADPNPATIKIHSSDNSVNVDTSASSGENTDYDLTVAGGGSFIADAPLEFDSSGHLVIPVATASADGYLSSPDWIAFNAKASLASPAFTGTPTAPTAAAGTRTTQLATTEFVQSLFDTENFKPAAYAATIAALPSYVHTSNTITGVANGPLTVDGTAIASGQRVLVKNETAGNAPYNGLYMCAQTGVIAVSPFILVRDNDMQSAGEFVGALVPILNGGTLAGQTWQCSTAPAIVDTNNVAFTIYSGASVTLDSITLQGADIASASTTDIAAATGRNVNITGTTTITALGTAAAGVERVTRFNGILTLTYNATSLITITAANITTAANDECGWLSLGSGNWRMQWYARADGSALTSSGGGGASEPAQHTLLGGI